MTIPEKLGKYQIRRELGQGAMGIVYEGFDPVIERRVAIKTVKQEQIEKTEVDDTISRFRREAQAAGRLTHANIVGIYEFGEDAGTAFIAMEFVEGRELKDYFDANERFALPEVRRIMGELLDALDYSHRQGVVHRDIKPANIILLKDGTVKVADFGIARIESSTLTQAGSVLGTPSYMSPEQFMGQTVDGRSDIFSAGVVLYQFLTGERPFTGGFTTIMHKVLKENPPPPSELNFQVPPIFDAVVRKALAKRPDERYQTADEFKRAILAVQAPAQGDATLINAPSTAETVINPASAMRPSPVPAVAAAIPPAAASAPPPKSKALPVVAIASIAVVVLAGSALAYVMWGNNAGAPGASPTAATSGAAPPSAPVAAAASTTASAAVAPPASDNGTVVISAVGIADPQDPRYKNNTATIQQGARDDARQQLIEKAAGLYVEQASLDKNYSVVRDKLLARNGEFIKTVLEEQQPALGKDGLMYTTVRATVNVRAVQKSLNQMSTEERIDFIRHNGDPKIAVVIDSHAADSSPDALAVRSPVAENLLTDRIHSFGFRVVSAEDPASHPDFVINGEVRFKKLSAKLPPSGITIEKYVLTSWTVKAIDKQTGEEIYQNTKIPEKQSWATEEQALQDVGKLVGEEFTKTFFLQYFQFPAQQARLDLGGLPAGAATAVFAEITALDPVLNATLVKHDGATAVIDTSLSGSAGSVTELVQGAILVPLNRKLGKNCLSIASATAAEVHVNFDASCSDKAILDRLEALPPAALFSAPNLRRDEVVKNPEILRRLST